MRLGQLMVFLGFAYAASSVSMAADIPGSSDLSNIDRYPNSYIVDFSDDSISNHQLVTGSIKKINGVVRADSEFRADGQMTQILYRIPEGHGNRAAFQHIQKEMEQQGFVALYQCEQRRCGSSNYWANKVFGIAQLYGPDNAQFYQIAQHPQKPGVYLAAYVIRRGNGRVYLLLEQFLGASGTVGKSGDSYLDIMGWPPERSAIKASDAFADLQAQLASNDQPVILAVSVGGSMSGGSSLGDATEYSEQYAQAIVDLLVEGGAEKQSIKVLGVGPVLLPDADEAQVLVRLLFR